MGFVSIYKVGVLVLYLALSCQDVSSQDVPPVTSDLSGKHFVFAFPTNKGPPTRGRSMAIQLFSTNSLVTSVDVAAPGISWSASVTLNQNQMMNIDVPDEVEADRNYYWQNGTIEVTSDRDIYVTAVSSTEGSDPTIATFPIPPSRSAFGYEFYVANYPPIIIYPSEIIITADYAGANVRMKKAPGDGDATSLSDLLNIQDGFTFTEISANEIQFSMSPFQSIQLRYTLDFTGMQVTGNLPISVLSGGECTHVTTYEYNCNHLAAYMPPVDQLGKRFTIAPFAGRTSGYIYRVVIVRDNTTFTIDGGVSFSGAAGSYYSFDVPNNHVTTIISDKPVLVVQFSKGYTADYTYTGAFMTVVPPQEQYVNSISFANFNMNRYSITKNYLNLIISCEDLENVLFNNLVVDDWIDTISIGDVCVARRELNGVNRVNFITHTSPNADFTAFVYGSGSTSSSKLSYGYPINHGFTQLTCTVVDRFNQTREVDCNSIGNDTETASIEFTTSELTVHEGEGPVYLTLRNNGASSGIVYLQTGGGTATEGNDYVSLDERSVTVTGYGYVNVQLELIDDRIAETNEYFTVSITGDTGGGTTEVAVTILDHYELPILQPDIPGLTLICEGTNMTLIFNASVVPYTNPGDVHLLDSDCVASPYGHDQAIISTDYDVCQTIMLETEGHILFRNALISGPVDDDSPIDPPQIRFQCAVERRYMVDTSYLASHKTQTAFGNFTFALDIYEGPDYHYPYRPEDYPVPFKVNDDIYLAARVFTVNPLELFIDSCWATPTSDPWGNTTYSLIRHGCLDESTVTLHDSGIPTIDQFSYRVFKFKGNNWRVYVHCQLLVCDLNTLDSRCSQGCVNSRNRRDTERVPRSDADLHIVSTGPLTISG